MVSMKDIVRTRLDGTSFTKKVIELVDNDDNGCALMLYLQGPEIAKFAFVENEVTYIKSVKLISQNEICFTNESKQTKEIIEDGRKNNSVTGVFGEHSDNKEFLAKTGSTELNSMNALIELLNGMCGENFHIEIEHTDNKFVIRAKTESVTEGVKDDSVKVEPAQEMVAKPKSKTPTKRRACVVEEASTHEEKRVLRRR